MDRNQVIGFILIFALLLGYTYFNAPSEEELEQRRIELEEQARQDSIAALGDTLMIGNQSINENIAKTPVVDDSLAQLRNAAAFGNFATASIGTGQEVTLENDFVRLRFNTKGGKIVSAVLKKHDQYVNHDVESRDLKPVELLANPANSFEYLFPVSNLPSGVISTKDLYFSPSKSGNELTFTINTDAGGTFKQIYRLADDGYNIDYDIVAENMGGTYNSTQPITLKWENHLEKLEKNETFEQRYSTIYYKKNSDSNADYCSCTSDDEENLNDKSLNWISFSNQFFNTSLMAKDKPFDGGVLTTEMVDLKQQDHLKLVKSELTLPLEGSQDQFSMNMYIGPNEYERLQKYDNSLEQIIPFGNSVFGTINRWVIRPFFNFLSSFISSKGLVIITLIFLIKMLLYPLMYKMLHSQALMGALKPEVEKLTEKYKEDPQKKQMETMKIYREYGVSPFGGCLPMVLQMPIWYALFRFFPASITFRQEPFLWAHDLSTYDDFFHLPFEIPFIGSHLSLFTILWAVSTIVYTYYNTRNMDMSANPAMKYVQYFMPIMFLGFFNNYAAGLTCYMLFSNLFNIIQTVVTKKFVFSDDKLKAELARKKAKPKKKNSFQERLEEAMKQQQQMQQQQKGKKKK